MVEHPGSGENGTRQLRWESAGSVNEHYRDIINCIIILSVLICCIFVGEIV